VQKLNRPANVDDIPACFACVTAAIAGFTANIAGAFNGNKAIPSDASNAHATNEPVVLDRNRHTTCADCHNSHAAQPTTAFSATPDLRPAQIGVAGVTLDGVVVATATYQYENCLRCHGTSQNKQSLSAYGYMPARSLFSGDTLNVSLQFAHGATSSHPVMRDATLRARAAKIHVEHWLRSARPRHEPPDPMHGLPQQR
jgi:hypothetical protein